MTPYRFNALLSESALRHGTCSRNDQPQFIAPEPLPEKNKTLSIKNNEEHRRFLKASGMDRQPVSVMKQMHSDRVIVVESTALPEGLEGDALITAEVDRPIGIYTADCVPVILYDHETHTAGVVHAGRAGTAKGIVPSAIKKMTEHFGVQPATLKVAIGPSIGPCCYEVEEHCLTELKTTFPNGSGWVRAHTSGKVMLDLWQANRDQAFAEGVPVGQIFLSGECTVCQPGRWYSYRREGNRAGRMLTAVMLCRR